MLSFDDRIEIAPRVHMPILGLGTWVEIAILGLLAVIAVLSLGLIVFQVFRSLTQPPFLHLDTAQIVSLLGTVIVGFVMIELLRIGLAYARHENVVPTVLEASLVAIARRFVVFEPDAEPLAHSISLALLMLAVGLTWYLVGSRLFLAHAETERGPVV